MSEKAVEKLLYFPLFHDHNQLGHERSDKIKGWVNDFLIPAGLATFDESQANAYLVATGDGGMMHAVRANHDKGKIFVGINCGTLGFLLNPIDDISQIPQELSQLTVISLRLMAAMFINQEGETKACLVFNDVIIGKDVAAFATFDIKGTLSGFPNRRVRGTGLVISTPQGATGYAIRSGGSHAMYTLDSNIWYIGGICTGPYPCDPVTPQEITIDINCREAINGYADGRSQTAENLRQVVITPTEYHVNLGFIKNLDIHARRRRLIEKIERGDY